MLKEVKLLKVVELLKEMELVKGVESVKEVELLKVVTLSINPSWRPQRSSTPGTPVLLIGHTEFQLSLVVSSHIHLQN